MFSTPGSMTVYSTATRSGLVAKDNVPWVGPGCYNPKYPSIVIRKETLPPFDNTAKRITYAPLGNPSPCHYNPWQRPRYEIGCPLFKKSKSERLASVKDMTGSPGPVHKLPDPWLKMLIDIWASKCMKPRVKFEKYVSNNVPTVFHALELRCFVSGVDGRMYPWRMNRKFRTPGPRYNTYKILTSQSFTPRVVDFSLMSKRPPLFRIIPGFGPADFCIKRDLYKPGGTFLSSSHLNPKDSAPRLFDYIINHNLKTIYPSPFHYSIIREFDRMCPKAVSAPFKSTNARLMRNTSTGSRTPAPNTYFDSRKQLKDLVPFLRPRASPPVPVPFLTSAERFPVKYADYFLPSPSDYSLPGMSDNLNCRCKRYDPAIPNPKMGFLVSARQCACFCDKKVDPAHPPYNICDDPCASKKIRKWQDIHPKKIETYTFWKGMAKSYASPGPIYDTRPGYAAIKGHRSWWHPRSKKCKTGFLNSGKNRKIVLQTTNICSPGPAVYNTRLPLGGGGRVIRTEPRFAESCSQSTTPGPGIKCHEKISSSMWRATHLGTFNVCLKGVYRQRPSAGGFHPYGPIDQVCDTLFEIERKDEYACCPQNNLDC